MAVAGKQKPDVKEEAAPSLLDELERLTKLQNILDDLPLRKRAAGAEPAARVDALVTRAKTLRKAMAKLLL